MPAPPAVTAPDTQGPVAPTVTIRTDRRSYRAGDPVVLTVINGTSSVYYYNPCTRIVERASGASWTAVKEDRICTMIAHVLDGRATQTERTELGEQLTPGRYRLVVLFSKEDGGGNPPAVRAASEPITVE